VAAVVLVAAARETVRARAGHELHLHRSLPGGVSALAGARERHFFDGVEARADNGEEAVASLRSLERVVLDVDPVERDVDRRPGQSVDGRLAVAVRRGDPRQERDENHRAAAPPPPLWDIGWGARSATRR